MDIDIRGNNITVAGRDLNQIVLTPEAAKALADAFRRPESSEQLRPAVDLASLINLRTELRRAWLVATCRRWLNSFNAMLMAAGLFFLSGIWLKPLFGVDLGWLTSVWFSGSVLLLTLVYLRRHKYRIRALVERAKELGRLLETIEMEIAKRQI